MRLMTSRRNDQDNSATLEQDIDTAETSDAEAADADPAATSQDSDDAAATSTASQESRTEVSLSASPVVSAWRRIAWSRPLVLGILPVLALLFAGAAGYLKWELCSARVDELARIDAVATAKDATVAILGYQPDTAAKDLHAARDRLTGTFKDSYTQLITDIVIPGATKKHISATATVPAAAAVSASASHAVVLVCVDQTTTIGQDPPSDSTSSVRVTLDKVGGRWLLSGFDPI